MNSELRKKIELATPKKGRTKSKYGRPLKVLAKGAERKPEGYPRGDNRSEAEQMFYSINWSDAWHMFVERKEDGTFKYATARDLAYALAVGIGAETKNKRRNYLYWAIGPISNMDKTKKVPYLGDWDMLRSQTFLGEMQHDSLLFGAPRMRVMRQALREHIDVIG